MTVHLGGKHRSLHEQPEHFLDREFLVSRNRLWNRLAQRALHCSTWVFPPGELRKPNILDTAQAIPEKMMDLLRSVEVSLEWSDGDYVRPPADIDTYIRWLERFTQTRIDGSDQTMIRIMTDFAELPAEHKRYVFEGWSHKSNVLARLRLEHVRFDMRAACDYSGEFVGVDFIRSKLRPFKHGLPPHLEVIAPTKDLEAQVLQAIREKQMEHFGTLDSMMERCRLCQFEKH